MNSPLCFVDTETTGIHPGRRPWEIALIRRGPDGTETEKVIQVSDVDLSAADPFGLRVGGFYDRHLMATTGWSGPIIAPVPAQGMPPTLLLRERDAASVVELMTRGAHIVGAVPNFDTETLDAMLRRHQLLPAWHYHLVDVEALAVGYLAGRSDKPGGSFTRGDFVDAAGVPLRDAPAAAALPWKSDDLSRACGVMPPTEDERHTALGDARWAMRIYDAIMGLPS